MQLLYDFALTPDVFSSAVVNDGAAETALKEVLKGIQVNGLIADLNKGRWLRHVSEERVPTLSTGVRDKVIAMLEILDSRHRIVRHPRRLSGDPANDSQWLELAIESHRRLNMQQIIAGPDLCRDCTEQDAPLVSLPDVLDSMAWQARRSSRTLQKTIAETSAALAPLLRYARAVMLVDPYLCPRANRFLDVVKLVLELAGQRSHGQQMECRVDIHCGDPGRDGDPGHAESAADRLQAWKSELETIAATHRVRVFLWRNYTGGENLHDRFIITDQIGVSVPGGLDCRTGNANSTTWTRMDFEDQILWASRFDPAANVYDLLTPPLEVRLTP